ncbi:hypothetical protein D3C86_1589430 [compost metagenome]
MHDTIDCADTHQAKQLMPWPAKQMDFLFQVEHALAVIQQTRTDAGQFQFTRLAVKQTCANLLFERCNSIRDRSLRKVQVIRCCPEAFEPGHLHKCFDKPSIHEVSKKAVAKADHIGKCSSTNITKVSVTIPRTVDNATLAVTSSSAT